MSAFNRPAARSTPPAPAPSSEASDKSRYRVMAPIHREGRDKPFWLRLGTAFENPGKNGAPPSISVKLDAAPMGGELVLFVDEERDDSE
jgi:hypothetical protein